MSSAATKVPSTKPESEDDTVLSQSVSGLSSISPAANVGGRSLNDEYGPGDPAMAAERPRDHDDGRTPVLETKPRPHETDQVDPDSKTGSLSDSDSDDSDFDVCKGESCWRGPRPMKPISLDDVDSTVKTPKPPRETDEVAKDPDSKTDSLPDSDSDVCKGGVVRVPRPIPNTKK